MSNNTLVKKKKRSMWHGTTIGDKIFLTIVYGTIILVCLACIYPMYLTIIASVSEPMDVYNGKVNLLPSGFNLKAYEAVFKSDSIWLGYSNSLFYTVVGTLFNLFLTIPAAYALSKKRMYGRSFLTTVFLITMYFGGGLIPTYILFKNLGLVNTRWILIINGGLSVYNVVVTRTYFQNNIPDTLFEAARIDGAGEFLVFFKLVLPLSAPIIAVMTLYYAVGHWGSYFSAMIYTTKPALRPLQLVLREILLKGDQELQDAYMTGNLDLIAQAQEAAQRALAMKYSVVFIASAPMLIAYPFVQKHFVKGVMVGSLKG